MESFCGASAANGHGSCSALLYFSQPPHQSTAETKLSLIFFYVMEEVILDLMLYWSLADPYLRIHLTVTTDNLPQPYVRYEKEDFASLN